VGNYASIFKNIFFKKRIEKEGICQANVVYTIQQYSSNNEKFNINWVKIKQKLRLGRNGYEIENI